LEQQVNKSSVVSKENKTATQAERNNKELKQRKDVKRNAGDVTSADGSWRYTVSGGNARITGYTGSAAIVRIPDAVDGYTVTEIGSQVFSGSAVRNVTFPKMLKTVGDYAFSGCKSLTDVSFTRNEANGYTLGIQRKDMRGQWGS